MDQPIGRPTRFLVRTLLFLAAVGGVVYLLFEAYPKPSNTIWR